MVATSRRRPRQAYAPWLRAGRARRTVAASAQGLDRMQRLVGIELAAQSSDEHLDDVAVALVVLVVEPLGELGLRDHVARTQHHVLEDAVFESGELDRRAFERDGLRARVEADRAALEDRARPATRAAQQRLHARQHFFEVIRLGDVVVGAGLQALDLVLPAVARGQDEDRKFLARGAQLADQIETRESSAARDRSRRCRAGIRCRRTGLLRRPRRRRR